MIYIMLADGFEEAEALVPADLLRRAGKDVMLCSIADHMVTGSHNIRVEADGCINEASAENAELVMLPGGLKGTQNLGACEALHTLLTEVSEKGGLIAAICAAPSVLGGYGMLAGKKATCYPGFEDALTGADTGCGKGVVRDGNIITGKAAGAAFDFGLALVEALCGADAAQEIAGSIYYGV